MDGPLNNVQGRHGRQGSQCLVLGWILKNRKWRWQWGRAGEVAAAIEVSLGIVVPIMDRGIEPGLHQFQMSHHP